MLDDDDMIEESDPLHPIVELWVTLDLPEGASEGGRERAAARLVRQAMTLSGGDLSMTLDAVRAAADATSAWSWAAAEARVCDAGTGPTIGLLEAIAREVMYHIASGGDLDGSRAAAVVAGASGTARLDLPESSREPLPASIGAEPAWLDVVAAQALNADTDDACVASPAPMQAPLAPPVMLLAAGIGIDPLMPIDEPTDSAGHPISNVEMTVREYLEVLHSSLANVPGASLAMIDAEVEVVVGEARASIRSIKDLDFRARMSSRVVSAGTRPWGCRPATT